MTGSSTTLAHGASPAAEPIRAERHASQTASQSIGRIAVLVGLFFASLYFLTMGGHTSSVDEEQFFSMTQTLLGRDRSQQDAALEELVAAHGPVESNSLANTGIVHATLAVPLYLLGVVVGELSPPEYSGFVTRFAVGLLDPIVCALTCVLTFLVGLQLGYSQRVSLLIAFAYGLATLTWPYSKYFFREPTFGLFLLLAVYAAINGSERSSLWWPGLAGLAAILAVGTKIAATAAVPGLLLYLALSHLGGGWRRWSWRPALRKLLRLMVLMALPAIALLLANYVFFEDPLGARYGRPGGLATYGRMLSELDKYAGLLGLLFSPGKSILLYAPITLLSLAGIASLWSRRRLEAGLFIFVIVSQLVGHGRLSFWHGDEAWGPRYLVPIVPLLTLPSGAVLMWTTGLARRVAWYAFAGLFTLGVLVGSGGVLFSYLAYTSRTGGAVGPLAEQRRWDPAMSPILGHWRMAGERLAAVRAWQPPDVYMTHGYFWIESLGAGPLPRWTDGTGQLELREPGEELDLTVAYQEYRAPWLQPADVTIFAASNGRPATVTTETETRGDRRVLLSVIEGFERSSPLTVEIRSDTWVPAEAGVGSDRRSLGVLVQRIQAELDGRRLRVGSDLLPPLPVSEAKTWSSEAFFWFVLPLTQLLDIWWWHLYFSGLPRIALLLAIPPAWGLLCTGQLLLRALTRELGCEPE